MFKNYKRHGHKVTDKNRVDNFRKECEMAIDKSKEDYLKKLGDKLINPNTSQKSYCKIINRVMNKCKATKIPPLLKNSRFIINCKAKADEFIAFFHNNANPKLMVVFCCISPILLTKDLFPFLSQVMISSPKSIALILPNVMDQMEFHPKC